MFAGTQIPAAQADESSQLGLIPRAGQQQNYPQGTPALRWSIKESFVRYVGGKVSHAFSGLEVEHNDVTDSDVLYWPLKTVSTGADGVITANYAGTVNFQKYCEDAANPKRGDCLMDLTIMDPTIVFNPETMTGSLWVTVHNFVPEKMVTGAPGTWVGPVKEKFADLTGDSVAYNNTDGVATVTGLRAALTEFGATQMLAYSPGQVIDSPAFSFPATDFRLGEQTGYTVVPVLHEDLQYHGGTNLWNRSNGTVLITGTRHEPTADGTVITGWAAIVDSDGDIVAEPHDYPVLGGKDLVAFSTATDTLYFVGDDQCTVYKTPVTDAGIGEPEKIAGPVGTCAEELFGDGEAVVTIGVDNTTGMIGVIRRSAATDDGTKTVSWTLTQHPVDGSAATTVPLPSGDKLYGTFAEGEYYDATYGDVYYPNTQSLRGLGDGTWLSVFDRTVNAGGRTTGGVPVHITPGQATTAAVVDAMRDQFYDKSHSYRFTAVGSGKVVVYNGQFASNYSNTAEDKKARRVGVYSYTNGTFSREHLTYLPLAWTSLSSIEPVGDSFFVVGAGENTAHAGMFSADLTPPADENTVKLQFMKNLNNTAQHSAVAVDGGYMILGQRETDTEKIVLNVVKQPTGDNAPDPQVEPVKLGDAPVIVNPDKGLVFYPPVGDNGDTVIAVPGQTLSFTPKVTVNGNPLPAGAVFTLGEKAPAGVTIEAGTGTIRYAVTKPGEVIIPVKVSVGGDSAVYVYSFTAAAPAENTGPTDSNTGQQDTGDGAGTQKPETKTGSATPPSVNSSGTDGLPEWTTTGDMGALTGIIASLGLAAVYLSIVHWALHFGPLRMLLMPHLTQAR
nr:HtaA domain-containing protein [Corynebacterium mendelii]